MNYILGGGSFSSRITKVVRTDNGLAYSTSSSFGRGGRLTIRGRSRLLPDQELDGRLRLAAHARPDRGHAHRRRQRGRLEVRQERPGSTPSRRCSRVVGSIVPNFATSSSTTGRWTTTTPTLAKYEKVTIADLKRVAQKWLQPDKMIIMVAGNIAECRAGADKMLPNQPTIDAMAAKFGGRTIDGLAKKYGDGTVHTITLK